MLHGVGRLPVNGGCAAPPAGPTLNGREKRARLASDRLREWLPRAADLPGVLTVAAVFWALGHAGFSLSSVARPPASTVALSAGFAIAAYLIWGYRYWVGVFLGALAAAFESGASLPLALGAAVSSAFGNLVGAYLMREWAGFQNSLQRLRDVFALLLFGVIVARLVASGIGVANLWFAGRLGGNQLVAVYLDRVIGGAVGVLILAPLLLAFSKPRTQPLTWASGLEALGIALLLSITGLCVFSPFVPPQERGALAYLLIPFVIWAAIRFEARGAAVASLMVLGITLTGSAGGYGAFADSQRAVLLLALFNSVAAATGLIVAASNAERRSERALRSGLETLRNVFDVLPFGLWVTDGTGRIISTNAAAGRIWGGAVSTVGEVIAKFRAGGGDGAKPIETKQLAVTRALEGGETVLDDAVDIEGPGGERKSVLCSAVPLHDAAGERIGAVAVHQDVTVSVRAEKSLRELAAVVQQTDDIVSITDRGGVIKYVNPSFERVTGYTSAEVIGRTTRVLKSGRHEEGFYAQLWTTILAGKVFRAVVTNRKKSGELYHEAKTITPIGDEHDDISQFVSTGKDITERIHAEERIERLARARSVMAECNRVLVQAADERQMFRDMCRIAVELGGYRMAWVGLVRNDAECSIEPVAIAGDDGAYFESVRISWADNDFGRGPAGLAVRTGVPQAIHDIATDPRFAQARKQALARGYRAAATLPLAHGGETLGVFGLFAAEAEAFSSDEIVLLRELGDDIGFGTAALRTRAERDRSRRALQESERFSRATLDAMPANLCVLDESGTIIAVNKAWCEFAAANGAVVDKVSEGADYFEVCRAGLQAGETTARAIVDGIQSVIRGETDEFQIEYPCHSPQQQRWFLGGASRFTHGGAVRVVMTHFDITKRKSAELALQESEAALVRLNAELEQRVAQRTAALERANRELEAFSYSVSHDLRAPLRAMIGFGALVLEANRGKLDGDSVDYLQRIAVGAKRMELLIDDLLALSRISRREMHRCDFNLSAVADEIVASLLQSHPERKVRMSVQPGLRANGDPGLVRIGLENLLGNAWKFTSRTSDARIELGLQEHDGVAVYYVRDNGAGFDMRYADKLFGAFQRLHRPDEFQGIGIGLSIVRRVIDKHGGRVWAESQEGQGATFYFTLGNGDDVNT